MVISKANGKVYKTSAKQTGQTSNIYQTHVQRKNKLIGQGEALLNYDSNRGNSQGGVSNNSGYAQYQGNNIVPNMNQNIPNNGRNIDNVSIQFILGHTTLDKAVFPSLFNLYFLFIFIK